MGLARPPPRSAHAPIIHDFLGASPKLIKEKMLPEKIQWDLAACLGAKRVNEGGSEGGGICR